MNRIKILALALALLIFSVGYTLSFAEGESAKRAIGENQTEGFGEGQILVFTYSKQFFCNTQPCTVGVKASSTPTGEPLESIKAVWVIVPFWTDKNGKIAALDPESTVPTHCPEPGAAFGTCTKHPKELLLPLGPNGGLIKTPLPKHNHIVTSVAEDNIPWIVIVVLVTDLAVWPDVNGTRGLTSLASLKAAQAAGQASADISSNFFLFFDVKPIAGGLTGFSTVLIVGVVLVAVVAGSLLFYIRSKKPRKTRS